MGSLSFVMYFGKLIITRKLSCTLFFFEKVVKWCYVIMLNENICAFNENIIEIAELIDSVIRLNSETDEMP